MRASILKNESKRYVHSNMREYQSIQFSLVDHGAELFACGEPYSILARKKYFMTDQSMANKEIKIVNDGEQHVVIPASFQCVNSTLLQKHGLMLGKCDTLPPGEKMHTYVNELIALRNRVIDTNLYWVNLFFENVYSFIQTRYGGLINKELVRVMMADVVSRLDSVSRLRLLSDNSGCQDVTIAQQLALSDLKSASQMLAKMYGGRAILQGSINEMIMIFEYMRDIYF